MVLWLPRVTPAQFSQGTWELSAPTVQLLDEEPREQLQQMYFRKEDFVLFFKTEHCKNPLQSWWHWFFTLGATILVETFFLSLSNKVLTQPHAISKEIKHLSESRSTSRVIFYSVDTWLDWGFLSFSSGHFGSRWLICTWASLTCCWRQELYHRGQDEWLHCR